MSDLISRLSTIRSNYNLFDSVERPYYHALSEAIDMAKATQWIPCSERLPEDGQTVIFTYDKDKVECGWFNQTRCVCNNDSYFISEFEFTAWMPLPEPYKEES